MFNTLRPRQNGCRFTDNTFKCIFLNENVRISIKISLKFVPKGPINYNPALVQIMAWCRSGDKPLSEPMMVSLLTHICLTRPQWVKKKMQNFPKPDIKMTGKDSCSFHNHCRQARLIKTSDIKTQTAAKKYCINSNVSAKHINSYVLHWC